MPIREVNFGTWFWYRALDLCHWASQKSPPGFAFPHDYRFLSLLFQNILLYCFFIQCHSEISSMKSKLLMILLFPFLNFFCCYWMLFISYIGNFLWPHPLWNKKHLIHQAQSLSEFPSAFLVWCILNVYILTYMVKNKNRRKKVKRMS